MNKSPDAFRTISEVAEELDLPQHVLRFWETRFSQIKPLKRGGGRRYYRPEDVDLLKGIRRLLYDEGYTIRGLQRILKEQGNKFVIAVGTGESIGEEGLLHLTDRITPQLGSTDAVVRETAFVTLGRLVATAEEALPEPTRATLLEAAERAKDDLIEDVRRASEALSRHLDGAVPEPST